MQSGRTSGVVRLIDQVLVVIGCVLLVSLFTTVLLGIVTRAFNEPLTWTDEGARFLMVWLACAGWIIAGRRRAHVRINFFLDRVPHTLQRATNVLTQLVMLVLGTVIGGFGVLLVQRNLDMDANSLPISAAWMYVPIVPAGIALVVQSLVQLVEVFGSISSATAEQAPGQWTPGKAAK